MKYNLLSSYWSTYRQLQTCGKVQLEIKSPHYMFNCEKSNEDSALPYTSTFMLNSEAMK